MTISCSQWRIPHFFFLKKVFSATYCYKNKLVTKSKHHIYYISHSYPHANSFDQIKTLLENYAQGFIITASPSIIIIIIIFLKNQNCLNFM